MSMPPNTDTAAAGWRFDNSYARLPETLYSRVKPVPVRAPELVIFNQGLADELELDAQALDGPEGAAIFAGNRLPEGADPLAQAYAGHQFGHFTMLGDGRATLLGEHLTGDQRRVDVQLKGSGITPYSRGGDGRAALGPMLREYVISEALHALGVPSTRSLAVVSTGEQVLRQESLPGAILTRIASSHIRVGTFEYAAGHSDKQILQSLADYTISRHYPELAQADQPYLELLRAVMQRQSALVAKWLQVGFIHGVMNTDNVSIAGETIDYGPCAFMDAFDPATVFSSIDRRGRYAYANQANITQWNLARLAEALMPLLHSDQKQALERAESVIHQFSEVFTEHWLGEMRPKLGLFGAEAEDAALVEGLQAWMHKHRLDYTNTMRALSPVGEPEQSLADKAGFDDWYQAWMARLADQPESKEAAAELMHLHNPAVIARNHRVEEALTAASEGADYQPLHKLLAALNNPYQWGPEKSGYTEPPEPSERVYQTFCGT